MGPIAQANRLGGVHLPGLMRPGRSGRIPGRPPAGGGGGKPRLLEPALQGTLARPGALRIALPEHHPDQAGAPRRVIAAQLAGDLAPRRRGAGVGGFRPRIAGRNALGADAAEAATQRPDGSLGEVEGSGQGRCGLALLEPGEEFLADGERNRTGHGVILRGRGRDNHGGVIQGRESPDGKT